MNTRMDFAPTALATLRPEVRYSVGVPFFGFQLFDVWQMEPMPESIVMLAARRLVFHLAQVVGLEALVLVETRNLNRVELQTRRVVEQLYGIPLPRSQRVAVEAELHPHRRGRAA